MPSENILRFWFDELTPAQHFAQDDKVDDLIRTRFGDTWEAARQGELWTWRDTARGRLAEILVLDQFSRNIHRGSALAFAQDAQALTLAQELVSSRRDAELPVEQRAFAYMPYMHSESLTIHAQAMALFGQSGLEHNLQFEQRHQEILVRFGRYPHRNTALGRTSTPQETAFLAQPGSSF